MDHVIKLKDKQIRTLQNEVKDKNNNSKKKQQIQEYITNLLD